MNRHFFAVKSNNLQRPLSEVFNKKFRRSIYFVKDLKKGHLIKEQDIRRIRPGYGLEPKYFYELIGRRLNRDVLRGEATKWSLLD